MKRIILYCCLALLLMGSIIGTGCAKPAPAPTPAPAPAPVPTIDWNLQSFTVPASTMWEGHLAPFVDLLKERSQGKFNITLHAPGAIVPSPQITKAIGEGVVEAGLTHSAYDAGVIPEAYVMAGLPFAHDDVAEHLDFWYSYKDGAAFKLLSDAYNAKGVQPIAILACRDPMVIMTQFPVSKVADFEGKKIRATGAHAEAIKALGAQQVTMGLGDVYNALQTGVIDGHFMAISGLESFKWKEVVKYVIEPAWMLTSPPLLEVNPNEWNKLPDDLKKLFRDTAREVVIKDLHPYGDKMYSVYIDSATKAGVQFTTLPPDEVEKYRECTATLWQYAEGKSPELVQILKAHLKEKGIKYPGS